MEAKQETVYRHSGLFYCISSLLLCSVVDLDERKIGQTSKFNFFNPTFRPFVSVPALLPTSLKSS